ncbi:Serine/threonine-protein kinase 32C [Takifugu flavidus]|uniref:Serine/threonine-protein kinase 32C n=1 Tax=Takifugu flavidus TaxID=433684 RepID=A0A5C6PIB5_9TELE|nr:Serine/threonine-protein kinase 32C [Takifugu flavidus]
MGSPPCVIPVAGPCRPTLFVTDGVNFDHFQILRAIGKGSFGKDTYASPSEEEVAFVAEYWQISRRVVTVMLFKEREVSGSGCLGFSIVMLNPCCSVTLQRTERSRAVGRTRAFKVPLSASARAAVFGFICPHFGPSRGRLRSSLRVHPAGMLSRRWEGPGSVDTLGSCRLTAPPRSGRHPVE